MSRKSTAVADVVAAIRSGSDAWAAREARDVATAALCEAIKAASAAWVEVCKDFDDARSWQVHRAAQLRVNDARRTYTRATVAERISRKSR